MTHEQLLPDPYAIGTNHARDLLELLNEQQALAMSMAKRVECAFL